jgi:TRAP-type mannitol/chloroaromatic compound transport system substrate-binding protein
MVFVVHSLEKLHILSEEIVAKLAEKDALAARIFDSYKTFRDKVVA